MEVKEKNWFIEQKEFSAASRIGLMESLFTVGNGYLGLRGDFPFIRDAEEQGTFINGFYESGPIRYGEKAYGFADNWQTIVPLPQGKEVALQADGEEILPASSDFTFLERSLNLKESSTVWKFRMTDRQDRVFEGTITILVPFDKQGTVRFQWKISIPESVKTIKLSSFLVWNHRSADETDDPRLPGHFDGSTIVREVKESKMSHSFLSLKAGGSGLTALCSMRNSMYGLRDLKSLVQSSDTGLTEVLEGEPDQEIILEKTVSYCYGESGEQDILIRKLFDELNQAAMTTTEAMVEEQSRFMADFWYRSDVIIDGDDEAQLSLRYNLFQLLQSTGRDSIRSIAAKGLSGSGYEGHYFWDAETYVLPFFIYTNRQIARSMLKFRISILDSAKKRAERLSHKGILFPWRTINGEECSAYFPAGTAQYHINSDIALGLSRYLEATGDTALLDEGGDLLLSETARFWCDLGCHVEGKGFCFHAVTGPDEYTAVVDNNYYTNLSARENLRAAGKWLANRIDDEERLYWLSIAEEIYLPEEKGITPQDDSFLEKEKWDFANTGDEEYPLLLSYHPLNIYRKQVLKQADVVMAQSLFPSELSEEQKRRNFDYYEQITTRDSSLSACAQGICAFHLKYDDLAWEYFNETLHTDRKDLHGNVSHGLHTAAMGGSYLMILNGFLGLETGESGISFKPALPEKLKQISMNLQLGESLLEVVIMKDSIQYKSLEQSIRFRHYEKDISLEEGENLCLKLPERKSLPFTFFRPGIRR